MSNAKALAKQKGVDINVLLGILKLRRPDGSKTEEEFVEMLAEWLGDDVQHDQFGNLWYQIGENPTTLWSCHTDTVSATGGHQNITWDGDKIALYQGKPGQSLGADDGAGLWLLLQMIQANKPGLYVFHRAEERGGKGSAYIEKNHPELLNGIQRAVAFDRKGTNSVITHQRVSRCCSQKFAEALATELNSHEPTFNYKPDDTGTFTDTANYTDLIPECTNISVGYEKEHGPKEMLDVTHLLKLREAVLAIDFDALATEREAGEDDWDDYGYSPLGWGGSYKAPEDPLEKTFRNRAFTLARIWSEAGYTAEDLDALCDNYWKDNAPKAISPEVFDDDDDEFVEVLVCNDCSAENPPWDAFGWKPHDMCPDCGSIYTDVLEFRRDQIKDLMPV